MQGLSSASASPAPWIVEELVQVHRLRRGRNDAGDGARVARRELDDLARRARDGDAAREEQGRDGGRVPPLRDVGDLEERRLDAGGLPGDDGEFRCRR